MKVWCQCRAIGASSDGEELKEGKGTIRTTSSQDSINTGDQFSSWKKKITIKSKYMSLSNGWFLWSFPNALHLITVKTVRGILKKEGRMG